MIESILVVEDQALLRETFVNVLRNEGISEALYEAQEGEEAVRVSKVLQPSLILLISSYRTAPVSTFTLE